MPKGVSFDPDRHGNPRYYFRQAGRPKVRLFEAPYTEAFDDEVACGRLGIPYVPKGKEPPPEVIDKGKKYAEGTLGWLVIEYKRRAAGSVSGRTMKIRARMLEEVCNSLTPKKKIRRGSLPFTAMERKHITEIRDEIRQTPGARNDVVKALSAMFSWAIETADLLKANPCSGIKRLKSGDGFHTWTEEEVCQFEDSHIPGSRARLALNIGLYTGFRLQTMAIAGRQHVSSDGWIKIRPQKTARSSAVVVEIPILPELQAALDEGPTGNMTFLITEYGKPFSVKGLGNKMRDWCDAAGLPHCSMHGLRKAGATRAAENGATEKQLMAIYGWTTMEQAAYYTEKANRKKMAKMGMEFLRKDPRIGHNGGPDIGTSLEQKVDEFVSPDLGVGKSETKTLKKVSKIKG
ncbi:tyrosine-type recombinase/integrase [Rhizobium sp. WYCCWR 11290]|uniref:Tyrosine-type recombinase/integrase n=1 Tax=Rhizobium changzhiense TaxID=2692317 RepID=A0A7Z0UCL0_9HYPH|nr:tyrosine-type recombinase/integrase [Rhizobium changzhiense]NZD62923.1 tyrosine-type recombinase/integrase [Rhizobium changzhiense]